MIGSSQLSSPKRFWVSGFFIHFCSISVHNYVYLAHRFGKQVQRINLAPVLICPLYTLLSRSKKRRGTAFWKFLAMLCWFAKRFPQGRSTVGLEMVCAVKDHFQNLIFYQHYHDDFVAVKMCHSPNPTPQGFMHMQAHCFPVSCDIFASRAVIRPERAE